MYSKDSVCTALYVIQTHMNEEVKNRQPKWKTNPHRGGEEPPFCSLMHTYQYPLNHPRSSWFYAKPTCADAIKPHSNTMLCHRSLVNPKHGLFSSQQGWLPHSLQAPFTGKSLPARYWRADHHPWEPQRVKRCHQLTQVPGIQPVTAEPFAIHNSLKAAGNCIHIILKSNVVSDVA